MANTVNTKGCCLSGCLTSIIVFVVIILLIVGAVYYVMGMTFDELGIADMEIPRIEQSVRDLGFADTKVKDVFNAITSLFKEPDESKIVTNPFNPANAAANLEDELDSLLPTIDGTTDPDYTYIFNNQLTTGTERYLVTLQDTDIAYLIDQIMETENQQEIDKVSDFSLNIREVTISEVGVDSYTVKMIFKLDLTPYVSEIQNNIQSELPLPPFIINNIVNQIPSALYFTAINNIHVDTEGELTTSANNVYLNAGQDNIFMDYILDYLQQMMEEANEGEEEDVTESLGEALGVAFGILVNNIGEVGTATAGTNNLISNHSTINLGIVGVSDGQISMITRMEEDPII